MLFAVAGLIIVLGPHILMMILDANLGVTYDMDNRRTLCIGVLYRRFAFLYGLQSSLYPATAWIKKINLHLFFHLIQMDRAGDRRDNPRLSIVQWFESQQRIPLQLIFGMRYNNSSELSV